MTKFLNRVRNAGPWPAVAILIIAALMATAIARIESPGPTLPKGSTYAAPPLPPEANEPQVVLPSAERPLVDPAATPIDPPAPRRARAVRQSLIPATQRYWALTGNDSTGDGSAGAPFRTVTKACQVLTALGGGVALGYPGTYSGTNINPAAPLNLIVDCDNNNIRVTSVDPNNMAKLLLTPGHGVMFMVDQVDTMEVDHLDIDLGAQTCNNALIPNDCTRNSAFFIWGNRNVSTAWARNISIHHNRIHGGLEQGIYATRTDSMQVYANEVYNLGDGLNPSNPGVTGAFDHGGYFEKSNDNLTMVDNWFHDITGFGFQFYVNNGGASNNWVVARNRLTGNGTIQGGCIYLSGVSGVNLLENNVCENNQEGIRISFGITGTNVIRHNTLIGNSYNSGPYKYAFVASFAADLVLQYNLIQGHPAAQIYKPTAGTWSGSYNLIAGTLMTGGGTALTATNTITTPMTFDGSAPLGWTPAAATSAIGAATGSTTSDDLWGNSRTGARDVGAVQRDGTPTGTTTTVTTTPATTTTTIPPAGPGCTRYEAEDMTPGSSAPAAITTHAGYSGTGYAPWTAASGLGSYYDEAMTSAGASGNNTIRVGYSSAAPATRSFYVDWPTYGYQQFTLPSTGGAWGSATFAFPGPAGAHATSISFDISPSSDSGSIDFDFLELCDSTPPATTTTSSTTTSSTTTSSTTSTTLPSGCLPGGAISVATVTASTGTAAPLTDGDTATAWTAAAGGPVVITMGFASDQNVRRLTMALVANRAPGFFTIEQMDAAGTVVRRNTRRLASGGTNRCYDTVLAPTAVSTRTIRLIISGAEPSASGAPVSLRELTATAA